MKKFVLKPKGRLKLKSATIPDRAYLRDVALVIRPEPDFCIEEVGINRTTVFRGTFPIQGLPTKKGTSLEKKLYLSAIIPAGSIVYITLRNMCGVEQVVGASVRIQAAAPPQAQTVIDLEER